MIHGLSVPSIIWKDIAPELARRGYRILLYGALPALFSLYARVSSHTCSHGRFVRQGILGRAAGDVQRLVVLYSARAADAVRRMGQGGYCGHFDGAWSCIFTYMFRLSLRCIICFL